MEVFLKYWPNFDLCTQDEILQLLSVFSAVSNPSKIVIQAFHKKIDSGTLTLEHVLSFWPHRDECLESSVCMVDRPMGRGEGGAFARAEATDSAVPGEGGASERPIDCEGEEQKCDDELLSQYLNLVSHCFVVWCDQSQSELAKIGARGILESVRGSGQLLDEVRSLLAGLIVQLYRLISLLCYQLLFWTRSTQRGGGALCSAYAAHSLAKQNFVATTNLLCDCLTVPFAVLLLYASRFWTECFSVAGAEDASECARETPHLLARRIRQSLDILYELNVDSDDLEAQECLCLVLNAYRNLCQPRPSCLHSLEEGPARDPARGERRGLERKRDHPFQLRRRSDEHQSLRLCGTGLNGEAAAGGRPSLWFPILVDELVNGLATWTRPVYAIVARWIGVKELLGVSFSEFYTQILRHALQSDRRSADDARRLRAIILNVIPKIFRRMEQHKSSRLFPDVENGFGQAQHKINDATVAIVDRIAAEPHLYERSCQRDPGAGRRAEERSSALLFELIEALRVHQVIEDQNFAELAESRRLPVLFDALTSFAPLRREPLSHETFCLSDCELYAIEYLRAVQAKVLEIREADAFAAVVRELVRGSQQRPIRQDWLVEVLLELGVREEISVTQSAEGDFDVLRIPKYAYVYPCLCSQQVLSTVLIHNWLHKLVYDTTRILVECGDLRCSDAHQRFSCAFLLLVQTLNLAQIRANATSRRAVLEAVHAQLSDHHPQLLDFAGDEQEETARLDSHPSHQQDLSYGLLNWLSEYINAYSVSTRRNAHSEKTLQWLLCDAYKRRQDIHSMQSPWEFIGSLGWTLCQLLSSDTRELKNLETLQCECPYLAPLTFHWLVYEAQCGVEPPDAWSPHLEALTDSLLLGANPDSVAPLEAHVKEVVWTTVRETALKLAPVHREICPKFSRFFDEMAPDSVDPATPPLEQAGAQGESLESRLNLLYESALNSESPFHRVSMHSVCLLVRDITPIQFIQLVVQRTMRNTRGEADLAAAYSRSLRATELGGYILGSALGQDGLPLWFDFVITTLFPNLSGMVESKILAYFTLTFVLHTHILDSAKKGAILHTESAAFSSLYNFYKFLLEILESGHPSSPSQRSPHFVYALPLTFFQMSSNIPGLVTMFSDLTPTILEALVLWEHEPCATRALLAYTIEEDEQGRIRLRPACEEGLLDQLVSYTESLLRSTSPRESERPIELMEF